MKMYDAMRVRPGKRKYTMPCVWDQEQENGNIRCHACGIRKRKKHGVIFCVDTALYFVWDQEQENLRCHSCDQHQEHFRCLVCETRNRKMYTTIRVVRLGIRKCATSCVCDQEQENVRYHIIFKMYDIMCMLDSNREMRNVRYPMNENQEQEMYDIIRVR